MSQNKENPAELANEEFKKQLLKMFIAKNEINNTKGTEETKAIDEASKTWDTNDTITNLFSEKIKKDTDLKGKYAIILIRILILQLITLNALFILKGCNVLKFADSTFNIFITGGIAEIFILVRTIVKYLFSDDLSELLKIILKANNYKFKENKDNKNKTDKN